MNGDLSLSQSFGGLRIANPDDASPKQAGDAEEYVGTAARRHDPDLAPTNSEDRSDPLPSPSSNALATALRGEASNHSLSTRLAESSQVEFDASGLRSSPVRRPSPPSPRRSDPYNERNQYRQSIPVTYQDQPQTQFPQYTTKIPQNQRQIPTNTSSRPTSVMYNQPHANGSSGSTISGLTRDPSYRTSRQSVQDLPKRTNSRAASAALQAGVPVNDSHSERQYGHNPSYSVNAPLPPRRSSRGLAAGQMAGSAGSGSAPISQSPYEGGPLSSSEEWKEKGAAVGVRQEMDVNGKPVQRYVKKGVKDFVFRDTLGEGSYSTVMAATDRQTLKEYAIKILDKRHIIKEKKVKYVNIEKDTLNRLTDHPGIVRLYYTFQDERSLYFVLDIATGGELLGVLKRMKTFDEECTRFYGAQILDTIDYMHKRGIIHRDLKPENVLLDDQMHVKVTDFGTAKILDLPKKSDAQDGGPIDDISGREENRANSFVGTAEYVSPELLTDKNACKASDLWAFGCIIYQLLAGRPPFKASNEYQTFQKIVALDYEFPKSFPDIARDLVERLLVLDPARRLPMEHIKNHQFFDGITWGRSLWKLKAPRLKSYVPPPTDPIKLNGRNGGDNFPPDIMPSHTTKGAHLPPSGGTGARPQPRVITELPPPSQLDIEWSPVLTRNNERILKLGNLTVLSSPAPHSPNSRNGGGDDPPKKFSRFFGGSTTKKRQRLVMVTSSARIIIAAAGGDEKKTKMEISLLSEGCHWRSTTDSKGLTSWCVDTVSPSCTLLLRPSY